MVLSTAGGKVLIHAIANTIIKYLTHGIIVGDDTVFFACSTLGLTDEKDIALLLADEDCYGSGLCDLVFTPTTSLKSSLEKMIPPEGLSEKACEDIKELILDRLKNTRLNFERTGLSLTVNISGPIISRFVSKLNLNRCVMFSPAAETACGSNPEFIARVRVAMRNARYTSTPAREKFISDMIERMMSENRVHKESILDCLIFMLNLFGEYAMEEDMYSLISKEKRSLSALLSDISRYHDYAERYSMEYIMSRRIQRPAADYDDVMKKIYLSDLICTSMYGKPAGS